MLARSKLLKLNKNFDLEIKIVGEKRLKNLFCYIVLNSRLFERILAFKNFEYLKKQNIIFLDFN